MALIWAPSRVDEMLRDLMVNFYVIPLNFQMKSKIKINSKSCKILVNIRATIFSIKPTQNLQMRSWKNWQKSVKSKNSYQSQLSKIILCSTQ